MRHTVLEGLLCAFLCACGSAFQGAIDEGDASPDTEDQPDERRVDVQVAPDGGTQDGGASEASPGDDAVPDTTTDDGGGSEPMEDSPGSSVDGPTAPPEAGNEGAPEVSVDAPSDGGIDTCDVGQTFYRDRDRDGYGAIADHVSACTLPPADDAGTWTRQPGDCRDDLADVKPFKAGAT